MSKSADTPLSARAHEAMVTEQRATGHNAAFSQTFAMKAAQARTDAWTEEEVAALEAKAAAAVDAKRAAGTGRREASAKRQAEQQRKLAERRAAEQDQEERDQDQTPPPV